VDKLGDWVRDWEAEILPDGVLLGTGDGLKLGSPLGRGLVL